MQNHEDIKNYNVDDCNISDLVPGYVLRKRYKIQKLLGKGTSATVFLALDQQLGSLPVALKVFNPDFVSHPTFNKTYISELQASFKINHENVVRLYDLVRSGTVIAFVNEFIDGVSLEVLSQNWAGKLAPAQIKDLLLQSIRGLESIHGHKVIHRDLKPQNILINQNGIVKIADFGVAKGSFNNFFDNQVSFTKSTINQTGLVGTPYYIDIKVLNGAPYSYQSDLYALGIISAELLTGKPLFDISSYYNFLESKAKNNYSSLDQSECPFELIEIVKKLIGVNDNHFENAREAKLSLEKLPLRNQGLQIAPKIETPVIKTSLMKRFKSVAYKSSIEQSKSFIATILDIPKILILWPINLIKLVFGSGIIYIIGAFVAYYFLKNTKFVEYIRSFF
jgi:serine/threonine protein kinase